MIILNEILAWNECFTHRGLKMKVLMFLSLFIYSSFSQSITVPLKLDEYSQPVIELQVNGIPISFVLDTAAMDGLILTKRDKLRFHGIREIKNKTRSIDLSGKVSYVRSFIIPHVAINGISFDDVPGSDFEPWGLNLSSEGVKNEEKPTMSVVGIKFFKGLNFTIDYSNSFLSFDTSPGDANRKDSIVIPFKMTDEGLSVTVRAGQEHFNMIVDTGSSLSALKKTKVIHPENYHACEKAGIVLPIEHCEYINLSIDRKNLAGDEINAVLVDFFPQEFTADGILGKDFFDKFSVKADFTQGKLYLQKSQGKDNNRVADFHGK